MEKISKKISNIILNIVALTSLIIALSPPNPTDILIIASIILFVTLIGLVTLHISQLEEKIKFLDTNFKIIERLNKLEIKVFKK